jgi:hypothetical protein
MGRSHLAASKSAASFDTDDLSLAHRKIQDMRPALALLLHASQNRPYLVGIKDAPQKTENVQVTRAVFQGYGKSDWGVIDAF